MPTKLDALHDKLVESIEALVSGSDWAAMLKVASRFHRYSASNVLLIFLQRPDATRVAGFTTWKRLGRQVNLGAKGIAIIAPCTYKVKEGGDADDVSNSAKESNVRRLAGFKVSYVFDVSDTTGADLPEVAPKLLVGDAPKGLWIALETLVREEGFQVLRADCSPANGVTNYQTHTVTVRPDLEPAQAAKTLAHELGHVLCHQGPNLGVDKGRQEVEAESVAHIVLSAFPEAFDTCTYSFPYIATWAAGDTEVVRETAGTVLAVASTILERIAQQAAVATVA